MNPLIRMAVSLLALTAACQKGTEKHQHSELAPAASSNRPESASNQVQDEMRLLVSALETAVRGIAAGDVRPVEQALHRVHAAKEMTEAAIERGSYRLPKNADRVGRFRELDETFHQKLEDLAVASRANDVSRAARAVGDVLGACHGCHTEFRP
jgi:cytochrome c556